MDKYTKEKTKTESWTKYVARKPQTKKHEYSYDELRELLYYLQDRVWDYERYGRGTEEEHEQDIKRMGEIKDMLDYKQYNESTEESAGPQFEVEIYWGDLSEDLQDTLLEAGYDNWNVINETFPITTIYLY